MSGPNGRRRSRRAEERIARSDEIRELKAQQGNAGGPRFPSMMMPAEKSGDFVGALRRLWSMLGVERVLLVVVLALGISSVALVVIGPKLLGEATDVIYEGAFVEGTGIDFAALHRQLLLVVAVYAASWVLAFGQAWLLAGVVQRTMYRLREAAEGKLNRLPLRYVDTTARGDLLSRVTNDIDNFSQSLQQTMSQMITSILTLVGIAVIMFVISPYLAVVALVTVPLSVYLMHAVASRARPRFMDQWMHTGRVNAQAEEVFTGHMIVKSFGRQADLEDRFREENEKLFDASFRAQFLSGLMQPFMMFVGNLQYVMIAVVGGLRITAGAITVGDMQAFIQYARQFSQPLTQIGSMATMFQSGIASLERVIELLDAPEQASEPPPDGSPPPVRGRIVFDHVRFSYAPDEPLITDLSLVAEPGQTVAIVGPTGAGKTTLVNLLMRFYDLDGGTISLDGRDLAALPRREIRSKVGMVLQDTWLFGGTIMENIRYGNPAASDAEVLAAAQASYVDRFVHSLPEGYDTVLNEEADNISAGQKQLLTIARAFLANPSILILDEATSSVDTRTEVQIQEAMNRLRAQRTSFVIAHRLSTIRGADVILVMEDGNIVEQGDHDQLLRLGGAYARLYNSQFAGAAVDVDLDEEIAGHGPGTPGSGPGGPTPGGGGVMPGPPMRR